MDDLLLLTPCKKSHRRKLEDFVKTLLKNRLNISLKKCQLFKMESLNGYKILTKKYSYL